MGVSLQDTLTTNRIHMRDWLIVSSHRTLTREPLSEQALHLGRLVDAVVCKPDEQRAGDGVGSRH